MYVTALVTDDSKSVTKLQKQTGFLVLLSSPQPAFKPSYDLESRHLLQDVSLRVACQQLVPYRSDKGLNLNLTEFKRHLWFSHTQSQYKIKATCVSPSIHRMFLHMDSLNFKCQMSNSSKFCLQIASAIWVLRLGCCAAQRALLCCITNPAVPRAPGTSSPYMSPTAHRDRATSSVLLCTEQHYLGVDVSPTNSPLSSVHWSPLLNPSTGLTLVRSAPQLPWQTPFIGIPVES